MRLSAPLFVLKHQARQLARAEAIPLHDALDRIARREGSSGWSLLARRHAEQSPAARLQATLVPGEIVLVAARPRVGKTLFALELAGEAAREGQTPHFFTLEYTPAEVAERLAALDLPTELQQRLGIDCSDDICADYILEQTRSAAPGTLVVVDYLQRLDQRRDHPPLGEQLKVLADAASARGLIVVLIAQVTRAYDPEAKPFPDLGDLRLPNPVDLSAISRACFLSSSGIRVETLAKAASSTASGAAAVTLLGAAADLARRI